MLVDAGTILVDREPWRVQWTPQAAEGVPTTLAGILQARLDGLPAAEKAVLQCASVMGHIFWEGALAHLREAPPAGPAEAADLRAALAGLRQADFIELHTPSALAGTAEYHFKHSLMRARNLLQVRAYGIDDPEQRRMFLEKVPVHRELRAPQPS
jgi:predicted ATPase